MCCEPRKYISILRIQENDLSTSVLLVSKTARILSSSLTFGKKMLSVCFADKLEHTEMNSSDTDCRFQSFIKRNISLSKDEGGDIRLLLYTGPL